MIEPDIAVAPTESVRALPPDVVRKSGSVSGGHTWQNAEFIPVEVAGRHPFARKAGTPGHSRDMRSD